jgi:phage portal protein BeeE
MIPLAHIMMQSEYQFHAILKCLFRRQMFGLQNQFYVILFDLLRHRKELYHPVYEKGLTVLNILQASQELLHL